MALLQSWRQHFRDQAGDINVVGIGIAAFMRIAPAFFLPNYQIFCYRGSRDLALLREHMTIHALQELDGGRRLPTMNTAGVLQQPEARELFATLRKPVHVLVYKGTPEVTRLAEELGLTLVGNPSSIRSQFELKGQFPQFLTEAGVDPLEHVLVAVGSLDATTFERFQRQFGEVIVLQAAEVESGGGTTTGFIRTIDELNDFKARRMRHDPEGLRKMKVAPFVSGTPASILACVTSRGVLTSIVQTQIVDRPELLKTNKGGGLFCGHDWSAAHFSSAVQRDASRIAKAFGEVMARRGYKGVFGIDLIVTPDDRVVPIECNSRFTGAFPMISLLQMSGGVAPLDVYHIAEFLNVTWDWDVVQAEEDLQRPLTGGHLILSNLLESRALVRGEVRPGVHKLVRGKLTYLRPGFSYEHIASPGEFVLTSGIPAPGQEVSSGDEFSRLCHILARDPLAEKSGELTTWASTVAKRVYNAFELSRVSEAAPGGGAAE